MNKQRTHRSGATTPTAAAATAAAATAAAEQATDKPKPATSEAKGTELGSQIGHKLKAMFDDVVAEPVPEKFRQLLEELERKSGKP